MKGGKRQAMTTWDGTAAVGHLFSADLADRELEKLRTSLSSCGCFQAINHGMTSSFLDQVHSIGRDFFALPMREKLKFLRTSEDMEGYDNDIVFSEHQILDWTDRVYLITNPEDQRKFQLWPQNPENFREILQEYSDRLKLLNEVVLKALSRSLNLKESCFLDQYGENADMVARFNYYPPCPRPDLTLEIKPHADGSAITYLLQDKEVEGLQILIDDQWFSVPTAVPDTLLVNVGDQVERKQSISLEPGGQFELSGAPLETLHQTCAEDPSEFVAVVGRYNYNGIALHPIDFINVSTCQLIAECQSGIQYKDSRGT